MTDRDAEFVTGLSRADTAQEPVRVEDWTDEELAEWMDGYREMWMEAFQAEDAPYFAEIADRLRARQREEGDPLVPGLCPHCSGLMGHYGNCPHAPQREGEREPVAWRVRYRRIGRDWTWFRLHADKAKAVQDVEHLIQNYKSVSYAEAVPLYTEPPAKRELDEELERASREHEKTIRAMSEHLCDHTRLSMGGTKWICTRPPNHGGRHAWRPKPRADTEEGADG